ncbi:MAG TPA: hypothetical protein VGS20_01655 [Candidatus Acidoferrales bacterium]|nr:hypothetical protein [Candidatus Acidoferrales bacterium]
MSVRKISLAKLGKLSPAAPLPGPGPAPGDEALAPRASAPDLRKHRAKCSICRHPQLRQIEDDFLDWASAREIARAYKLPAHSTLLHHAHAMGLFHRRRKNLQRVLDRIIEKTDEAKPSAAAIVSAIRLAADLNTQGEWLEPGDRIYLKPLFDRMTPEELDAYARTGELPAWFQESLPAGNARPGLASGPDAASLPSSSAGEDEAGS